MISWIIGGRISGSGAGAVVEEAGMEREREWVLAPPCV